MVNNGILLIGALIVGWFLAGEPTSIKDLRMGINRFVGGGGGGGGGGVGGPADGVPYGVVPPGGPGGGIPEIEAIKKQLTEKDQQTMLQNMQNQFQQQMTAQQTQAQQQALQQQFQNLQAAASGAMGGGAGGGAAGVNPAQSSTPIVNPATTTVATADAANQVAASQQMLPAAASAVAPGVIPGQQMGYTDPMTGMPYTSPYGGTSYTDPTGGMQSLMQSMTGGPNYSGVPTMALPGAGGYPYGGTSLPTYGSPGIDTYMGTRFASNYSPPSTPINIQNPIVSPTPNVSYPSPIHTTDYHRTSTYSSPYHRSYSHLGIVDEMHSHPRGPAPFFHGPHHLMGMNLGAVVPHLHGVTLADLIAFSDSGTGREIFPLGIDRYDPDLFRDDILEYIRRILRNLTGHSPQEKMRILRELILAAVYERGGSIPPDITTYQNLLSKVPVPLGPDVHELPLGPRYVNDAGFVLPDKYANLQFKGNSSLPPMIRHHGVAGRAGSAIHRNISAPGHSLFFDINES